MPDAPAAVPFAGYPESVTLRLAVVCAVPRGGSTIVTISITDDAAIDDSELVETFVRASGPGGQNVNKVASAVQLRFSLAASASLAPDILVRLGALAGRRLTKEGEIVITANRFRSQERNREDARARLFELIARAAEPPAPPRRKTRPPKSSRERRLTDKRLRGRIKEGRGNPELS
jgi:ribosome-associated protein